MGERSEFRKVSVGRTSVLIQSVTVYESCNVVVRLIARLEPREWELVKSIYRLLDSRDRRRLAAETDALDAQLVLQRWHKRLKGCGVSDVRLGGCGWTYRVCKRCEAVKQLLRERASAQVESDGDVEHAREIGTISRAASSSESLAGVARGLLLPIF